MERSCDDRAVGRVAEILDASPDRDAWPMMESGMGPVANIAIQSTRSVRPLEEMLDETDASLQARYNEKFSVILPFYNGMAWIEEAVQSVIGQSYPYWEMILVDDGSSPEQTRMLADAVKRWDDRRIHFYSKDNTGLAETRNWAIRQSTGDYIAFLDQDDTWRFDKLAIQAAVFYNSPEIEWTCTEGDYIGDRSGPMRIANKWGFWRGLIDSTYGLLLKGSFIVASSVVLRKRLADDVGAANRAFIVVPDYEYWLRCARFANIYFVPTALTRYRIHGGNTSKQIIRGACEEIALIASLTPRNLQDRVRMAIHFLRNGLTIAMHALGRVIR